MLPVHPCRMKIFHLPSTVWLTYRSLSFANGVLVRASRSRNDQVATVKTHLLLRVVLGSAMRRFGCGVSNSARSTRGDVAHRELIPDAIHDTSQYANNRVELSHQPTRVRERGMRRFKSMHQAQRFLSTHGKLHEPRS